MSIAVAFLSVLLLRGTPESKAEPTTRRPFDWLGLSAFIVAMVALNVVIGQGANLGWLSPTVLTLTAVFVVSSAAFFKTEMGNANGFVDLALFGNRIFGGASLSNFLLNGAATVAPRGPAQADPVRNNSWLSRRGLRVGMRRWRKRSRQRVRDQVAHMAFGAETRMRSDARGYP